MCGKMRGHIKCDSHTVFTTPWFVAFSPTAVMRRVEVKLFSLLSKDKASTPPDTIWTRSTCRGANNGTQSLSFPYTLDNVGTGSKTGTRSPIPHGFNKKPVMFHQDNRQYRSPTWFSLNSSWEKRTLNKIDGKKTSKKFRIGESNPDLHGESVTW